jgi:hypothetical protein
MVNLLTVAQYSGQKLRLVLDLRRVNLHVSIDQLNFEDLKVAKQLFKCNQYMATFDLKSGYQCNNTYYVYTIFIAFGLKVVGLAFTIGRIPL